MSKLYVVTGTSGEYTDVRSWPVHAHTSSEDAERHRTLAQSWCDKVESAYEKAGDEGLSALRASGRKNPFDPGYAPDTVRTRYSVAVLPSGPLLAGLDAIEGRELTYPEAADLASCVEQFRKEASAPDEYAVRHELLKGGFDPDATVNGSAAWQAVLAQIPAEAPQSPPRF